MDLARAPRRARLTARKKGSGYENALGPGTHRTGTARKLALISNAHGN